MSCFAHLLHLGARKALGIEELSGLIQTLHKISAFLHKSNDALLYMKDASKWLGFPELALLIKTQT